MYSKEFEEKVKYYEKLIKLTQETMEWLFKEHKVVKVDLLTTNMYEGIVFDNGWRIEAHNFQGEGGFVVLNDKGVSISVE